MSKIALGVALAAVLAVSAGAACAQTVAQPPHLTADMAGFTGAPGSLTGLIGHVEQATGGRVIEIRFTNADGAPGYRAVVARGARVVFMRVAASNGDTVEIDGSSVPDWMLRWRDRSEVKVADHAKVSLTDAIRTAEQQNDGAAAVAAGISATASNPTTDVKAYNILVDRSGNVRRVAVDSDTNQVIEDPGALSWP